MLGWRKQRLESRLPGEISITSDTQMTTPLWQKWRTKQPLDGSEGGEWKSWLKAQIQKTRIMASGPITSWQIDGETVETVADFIFLGSNITVDDDCSSEIKRCLLLWRKVITNLDSILKSRDYFVNNDSSSLGYGFSSKYGCESCTIKTAEHWRIDAFELWCWRRLLRFP